MRYFYNSWDSAYKSHFGAIARNQSCQFTIRLPEETPLDFSPVLVVFRTGFKERFLPMNVKEHENGYVTYTTDLIPKYSGVHYYYFSYTSNGVRHYIKRRFEVGLAFRDEVTKALEEKRVEKVINKSQEAVVRATVPPAEYDVLTDFSEGFFEELLIVSKVAFERGDELTVEISVSDLDKCPRCWNFRVLGGNPHHPDVCERCGDALDAIG